MSMLNLIPIQYRALAVLLLALSLLSGGFYSGHRWATTKYDAARAIAADMAVQRIRAEMQRADVLATRLAAAEGRIITKTVEVIKYVPSVTTGRLCLDADAVGLLQPGAHWGPYPSTGEPAGQGAAHAAASDRDVAYWAAEANRLYETCAERMNALADWHAADPK